MEKLLSVRWSSTRIHVDYLGEFLEKHLDDLDLDVCDLTDHGVWIPLEEYERIQNI